MHLIMILVAGMITHYEIRMLYNLQHGDQFPTTLL